MSSENFIIAPEDPVLVTGASGFIGSRLVGALLGLGLRNLRCFVRPSSEPAKIKTLLAQRRSGSHIELIEGNLLSRTDCIAAAKGAAVVFHLAAGRGEKSFPDAFMNSVVTTRNLLEASHTHECVRRFVNVSSFAVYTNARNPQRRFLDESSPTEKHPALRGDAYSFAKVKQEEVIAEYGGKFGIPYVIVRPGFVYGPGNESITGRVGISTFGIFLHLGGSNEVPFTYVDNCAEAIALAGLKKGVDGEIFNVVDDDRPSSRQFLRLYKHMVRPFRSLYLPHWASYALCYLWERYSASSERQLEPVFNLMLWNSSWRKTRYSNEKLKTRLAWAQKVPTSEGLRRYFEACRSRVQSA